MGMEGVGEGKEDRSQEPEYKIKDVSFHKCADFCLLSSDFCLFGT